MITAKPEGIFEDGKRLLLRGVNWFGLEVDNAFHGLWQVSWTSLLDFLKEQGYNFVRIPLNLEFMEDPDGTPTATVNFSANPDLEGKTAGQLLDIVLAGMADRGIWALPDVHRTKKTDKIDAMPINPNRSEARLIGAWLNFLRRFKAHDNIIGCDLVNEPHGPCTWAQWAGWAENIGNAILAEFPDKLIFVAGVEHRAKKAEITEAYWGSVLDSVKERPVKLSDPSKLVYTPHFYGPSVYPMRYHADMSTNVPKVMHHDFGYICTDKLGCVFLGEIGGKAEGTDKDFHEAATKYIEGNPGLVSNVAIWSLNPNSGDTKGILKDDWKTPEEHKLAFYRRMAPVGEVQAKPEPPVVDAPVEAPQAPEGGVEIKAVKKESWKQNADEVAKYEIDVINTTEFPVKPKVEVANGWVQTAWSCAPDKCGSIFGLPPWMAALAAKAKWSWGAIISTKPGKTVEWRVKT